MLLVFCTSVLLSLACSIAVIAHGNALLHGGFVALVALCAYGMIAALQEN